MVWPFSFKRNATRNAADEQNTKHRKKMFYKKMEVNKTQLANQPEPML